MSLSKNDPRHCIFTNNVNTSGVQQLTQAGEQAIQDMGQRYGVSTDAVRSLLFSVSAGGGSMAQFYHPELGGGGQWMRGGMTMVGDMFNSGLKYKVDGLCGELSSLLNSQAVFVPLPPQSTQGGFFSQGGNNWWPGDLGQPSSTGGQNDSRYAYFPQTHRLAIQQNGRVSLYDTLDHQIGGVQQQQGGYAGSLSFSSQFGTFDVASLPQVNLDQAASPYEAFSPAPQPAPFIQPSFDSPAPRADGGGQLSQNDILTALERLGDLCQKGILSEEEFRTKKADLLSRL